MVALGDSYLFKKRNFLYLGVGMLLSCYSKTQEPDYTFLSQIKQQATLDSAKRTLLVINPKVSYSYFEKNKSEVVQGKFSVKNIGKINFNILSIRPDCDCVKVYYHKTSVIPPNDSLIVFYERNLQNVHSEFSNSITIIGNCQYGNQTFIFKSKN